MSKLEINNKTVCFTCGNPKKYCDCNSVQKVDSLFGRVMSEVDKTSLSHGERELFAKLLDATFQALK